MILNVAVFFGQQVLGDGFTRFLGLTSASLFGEFHIWELVTYQFIHGGFSHIFWNMILLYIAGPDVEEMWGSKRFAQLYIASGAFAGILQVLIVPNSFVLGASGSIMGIFAVFALFNPNREMMLIFPPIPIKVKYIFLFYVITDLMGATSTGSSGIAHFAHLGGVVVGYVFFRMFGRYRNYSNYGQQNDFGNTVNSMFNNIKSKVQSTANPNMNYQSYQERVDSNKLNYYRKTMDELLDKINNVGYLQLTDDERKRLEEASNYLKKFDKH